MTCLRPQYVKRSGSATGISFELRFRLEAANCNWEHVRQDPEFLGKVRELQAAYDNNNRKPKELNRLCARLDLPNLRFQALDEHHTFVYEVEMSQGVFRWGSNCRLLHT